MFTGIPREAHKERQFETDHLMADLKGRSVRGGAVTMAAQGAKFALQIGSTAVLARLLTPADFGLIAMVTAVAGFVAMFKEAGLSMATIQREHITHAQVSTLFWINVALSLAVTLAIAALAPAIVWFYGEPRLFTITLALAATFIFGGLTVQHQALLRRQMKFTALATIEILSTATGIATAIFMAWKGFGYWSLVGLNAGTTLSNCALVWTISTWRPGLPRRGAGVRPMLLFGGNLTGFGFVNYFTRNADNILIGWWWGGEALGLYTKAYGLLMMPLRQINGPLTSVVLPALSRLASDPYRYQRYYIRVLSVLLMVTTPAIVFLIVTSDLIVSIVLGEQWLGASRIFMWLGLAGLVQPLTSTNGWLFISQGRTNEMFRWGCFSSLLTVGIFVLCTPFGVEAVAAGYALSGFFVFTPLLLWYVTRSGPVSLAMLCKATWAPFGISLLVGMGMIAVRYISPVENDLFNLSAAIFVLGIGYILAFLAMSKMRAEAVNVFRALTGRT